MFKNLEILRILWFKKGVLVFGSYIAYMGITCYFDIVQSVVGEMR